MSPPRDGSRTSRHRQAGTIQVSQKRWRATCRSGTNARASVALMPKRADRCRSVRDARWTDRRRRSAPACGLGAVASAEEIFESPAGDRRRSRRIDPGSPSRCRRRRSARPPIRLASSPARTGRCRSGVGDDDGSELLPRRVGGRDQPAAMNAAVEMRLALESAPHAPGLLGSRLPIGLGRAGEEAQRGRAWRGRRAARWNAVQIPTSPSLRSYETRRLAGSVVELGDQRLDPPAISSRVARTASSGRPFGSGRSQST